MTLEDQLLAFDGKSVTLLSEARMACRGQPGFHADLVRLCADHRDCVSSGATWILKAELEDGAALPDALTERLANSLPSIAAWQAQLHVCQIIPALSIAPSQIAAVRHWLWPLLSHQRPFVRAWALDALCHLAGARTDAEIQGALRHLADDPAASVRARVRNLRRARS